MAFLTKLGYKPQISLAEVDEKVEEKGRSTLLKKTAVAGFCFGNIMLFSFPFYLGLQITENAFFFRLFIILNAVISLPVIFYCASDYWQAGVNFVRHRLVTLELPVLLGILALSVQSYVELFTGSGEGYFDSLSGLLFFLLTGRYFQEKIYQNLSFERDYKSFFPLWANKLLADGKKLNCLVTDLQKGDLIQVRNQELIPCDAVLLNGDAAIDYSFVSGEDEPVKVAAGEKVYAGGRQCGSSIELQVEKSCSSSYLTALWNKTESASRAATENLTAKLARLFTPAICLIALICGLAWLPVSVHMSTRVFIAVLIVACPCALALSAPYTFGFATRFLNKQGLYLKSSEFIEQLAAIKTVIFDKTGTLSSSASKVAKFEGMLTNDELAIAVFLCSHSLHPVSRHISQHFPSKSCEIEDLEEVPGSGIKALCNGREYRIGNASFTGAPQGEGTFVAIDGKVGGRFEFQSNYREGLGSMLQQLVKNYRLQLLSGDNEKEKPLLKKLFPVDIAMKFKQSPQDKMDHILSLENEQQRSLMIGDGLNDAGALKEASAGIAVTENFSNFFPACDGILAADSLNKLDGILNYCRWSMKLIRVNFALSIFYNIIGIYLAASGVLQPVVCAVLMPLSSISILILSAAGSWFGVRRYFSGDNQ